MDNLTVDYVLTRGVEQILPDKQKLGSLMSEKKKITLYQGFDPTMPSLHLGHYVGLIKLRQFQRLGHKVIFLVGDFTGMIGDPTDKSSTRPKLTREETLKNARAWREQASRVLDFEGENAAEIKFNSKWLDKVTFKELIEITSNFTVQQMLERDMFQDRLGQKKPIHLHEFLYPVAQAIDCVEMDVDLEIGGSDQLFNMMAGRTLMKAVNGKEKYILTTKLLVDKKGNKVGKTSGNALFLDSTPEAFYAGIMSFPDEVIKLGFELLTEEDLRGLDEKIKPDPMSEKKHLAFSVVKILWGEKNGQKAQQEFEKIFQNKKPDYTVKIKLEENFAKTVAPHTANASISEAKRLITQGGVDVNGKTISNPTYKPKAGDKIRIGATTFGTVI